MITQATKNSIKFIINPFLATYGIKGTWSIYKKNHLVFTIKQSNSSINFIENYNENIAIYMKVYSVLHIESFNRHYFSGDAKKVVSFLFDIAKDYTGSASNFSIDYYSV